MSDKPTETPSQRAATKCYSLVAEIEQLQAQGDHTPMKKYIERLAAIIARETGCDANADIVRRLQEWDEKPLDAHPDRLMRIVADAAALRRAGGGAQSG